MLDGKLGLVVGVANDRSIATGCAKSFSNAGATLALTYLNDKARGHVEPVAKLLGVEALYPLDLSSDEELDELFSKIEKHWGRLDFLLHSVAFCNIDDLHGRVVDCSRFGFAEAMDISCHSFMRMAKRCEPLMRTGGSLTTVSFLGAERVVDHYNIMGPIKAALEAVTREMSVELGAKGIRVNAISPGPIQTRAASGIADFNDLMTDEVARVPRGSGVTIEEVGNVAAFLASDAASAINGAIIHIDGGRHARV